MPPIGSYYGSRTNPNGFPRDAAHQGVDIMAPAGTPVVASVSGFVSLAWYSIDARRYPGWQIVIGDDRRPLRRAGASSVTYSHLRDARVKTGQFVRAGQIIGAVGTHPTGDHVHYGVYSARGRHIDPVPLLVSDGMVRCADPSARGKRSTRPPAPLHVYPVRCSGGASGLTPFAADP